MRRLTVRALAERLELGVDCAPARWASRVWRAVADPRCARPVALPEGLWVVGIGGATLGGAGKTPVAVAVARALGADAARCGLVGHGYRARPSRARLVAPFDRVAEVGDDALFAARELADARVPVIVAPTRARSLALTSRLGLSIAVVDGLLQASPARVTCSVLVLDGAAPWGSGACPPAGDLRASRAALLASADLVAVVEREGEPLSRDLPSGSIAVPSLADHARGDGGRVPVSSLLGRRVGLIVAVARPARVVASLRAVGVDPGPVIALADHATPGPEVLGRAASAPVDVWVTTGRCATKLPASLGGRPVLALEHRLDVGGLVRELCIRLFGRARGAC